MIFDITEPNTGKSFTIEGDGAPSEQELEEIFQVSVLKRPIQYLGDTGLVAPEMLDARNPAFPLTSQEKFRDRVEPLQKSGNVALDTMIPQGSPYMPQVFKQPQGVPEGMHNLAMGVYSGLTSPFGVAAGPMATEAIVPRAVATLTKMLLAGMGAQAVGDSAGRLTSGVEQTPGEITQDVGSGILGGLMTLPLGLKVADALQSRPKMAFTAPQRRLSPPEAIDVEASVTLEMPPLIYRTGQGIAQPIKAVLPVEAPLETTVPAASPVIQTQPQPSAKLSTVQDAVARGAGGISPEEILSMPNELYRGLVQARGEQGVPLWRLSHDAVAWGAKQPSSPELLSSLDQMRKVVSQRQLAAIEAGDYSLMDRSQWFGDAMQGVARSGPNYEAFVKLQEKGGETSGQEKIQEENAEVLTEATPAAEMSSGALPSLGRGMQRAVEKNQERGSLNLGAVLALRDKAKIGFSESKVAGQQLWNRLKNVLGATSAETKVLEATPGFQEFLKEKRTPGEVAKWLEDNGPRVEVMKTSDGASTKAQKRYNEIYHEFETVLTRQQLRTLNYDLEAGLMKEEVQKFLQGQGWEPELAKKGAEFVELEQIISKDNNRPMRSASWQSIAPKAEKDMPGYTEIAIVKPLKKRATSYQDFLSKHELKDSPESELRWQLRKSDAEKFGDVTESPQFPSSHNFPPNTIGFVRGYMETLSDGRKVFHVIEVQSDWAQEKRRIDSPESDYGPNMVSLNRRLQQQKLHDSLLSHYERLALKAAIDHAREQGADAIAVSDAETAMMTEGHDRGGMHETALRERGIIPQEKGMRLHYDQSLQKIASELTGEKGSKVSFGGHKMAFEDQFNPGPGPSYPLEGRSKPRKDLIFHNPDGTPKTDVSAHLYPLTKARKDFSYFGSDKPQPAYEAPKGIGGGIQKALEKNKEKGMIDLGVIKEAAKVPFDVARWYSEPLIERLGRLGGAVSKMVSKEGQQIISRAKELYGSLTPVLDPAKEAASKAFRGGTTWSRNVVKVTPKAASNNFFAALEGSAQVPVKARAMMQAIDKANRAIGNLVPGFTATGKPQRIPTAYGIDIIRRGSGKAWDAWTEGFATANGVPVAQVRQFFREWKDEMDRPGTDVTHLNKISQDFVRLFPRTITHIKPGNMWQEVLVADPFNYLEAAAQRTSHAVAFREVYKPGSGLLEKTREAVQRELSTDRYGDEFDSAMRALQGMPTDSFSAWWNAPDSAFGGVGRAASQFVAAPIKAMVLTGNFVTNLAEVVAGGPAIFLGYRNLLPAMAKAGKLYQQLEYTGTRNRAMYNYAFDPTSPARSLLRQAINAIRVGFFEQSLNEVQEASAAMSAKVVADKIRAGKLSSGEKEKMIAVMRAMGFSEPLARQAVNGSNAKVLGQFERKAASWLTAGNTAMAEKSRAGASRLFNELFWFHSYPQMTLNQLRSVGGNFVEDLKSGNCPQAWQNAKLLGRMFGGRALQGALTVGLMALAYEWIFGVEERKQEFKDEPVEFLFESYLAAMGGPLYVMKRVLENSGDSSQLQQTIASTVTPIGLAGELFDASAGNGRYEGRDASEKIGMFVESKTPGWRMIKTGMALVGLSSEDKELESALRSFYRWKREELPRSTFPTKESGAEFRAKMRRAVEALQEGKDWRKELEGVNKNSAFRSFLGKRVLEDENSKKLTPEMLEKLRARIGPRAVERLQAYDAMLTQVAYEFSGKRPPRPERTERERRQAR